MPSRRKPPGLPGVPAHHKTDTFVTPHHEGVIQRGVSEAAEADELARSYHGLNAQLNQAGVTAAKQLDSVWNDSNAARNYASHLADLSSAIRLGAIGYAGGENLVGGEQGRLAGQRGLVREADIGAAGREATTIVPSLHALAGLPITVERLT